MSKKPISFKDHSRKRRLEKTYKSKAKVRRQPHEWDDFLDYWRYFFRNPLQVASPGPWTDRMLWSNAIVAGLLGALHVLVFVGFHIMFMLSAVINVIFDAFLFYYAMTWISIWVLNRTESSRRTYDTDAIRVQAIVYSGWILILSVLEWVPFSGLLVYLGAVALIVLGVRAVKTLYSVSWMRAIASVMAGAIAMFLVIMILNRLAGI